MNIKIEYFKEFSRFHNFDEIEIRLYNKHHCDVYFIIGNEYKKYGGTFPTKEIYKKIKIDHKNKIIYFKHITLLSSDLSDFMFFTFVIKLKQPEYIIFIKHLIKNLTKK